MDPGDAEEEELNPPFICPSQSVTQSSQLHCSPHPDVPLSQGPICRVNSIASQSTTSTLTTASNQQTEVVDESVGDCSVLKTAVKTYLWPKVKFIFNNKMLDFNTDACSLCGFLLRTCKKEWQDSNNTPDDELGQAMNKAKLWWDTHHKWVKALLTEQRNNAVKTVQQLMKSKCIQATNT